MSPKSAYSASFLSAQYLLHQTDYPEFLKYDSYVDCGMLFSIPLEKLMEGVYFGSLTDSDLQGIFMFSIQPRLLRTRKKSDSVLFNKVFVIMMYYERWG